MNCHLSCKLSTCIILLLMTTEITQIFTALLEALHGPLLDYRNSHLKMPSLVFLVPQQPINLCCIRPRLNLPDSAGLFSLPGGNRAMVNSVFVDFGTSQAHLVLREYSLCPLLTRPALGSPDIPPLTLPPALHIPFLFSIN